MGHSCEAALKQIKRQNYMQKVEKCQEILLVGISYNENKHHTCKIEKQERKRRGIEGSAAR